MKNELYGRVTNLAIKAFTLMHVHDNPLIHTGHVINIMKDHLDGKIRVSYTTLNNM